jgi:hypothetical protein
LLSILAATVLLSVGQLSSATAATINLSPDSFDFGNVTVGTTDTVALTATLTPNPGASSFFWDFGIGAPFSAAKPSSPAGNCGVNSLTCVVDVSFAPTTIGSVTDLLVATVSENPGGVTNDIFSMSGTGVAPVSNTPLPAALPLFASGLGALGLLGWRRKRKAHIGLLGAA